MIITVLGMLSKFMGKLMTVMLKTWHHTFAATKSTWTHVANDLYGFIHYGMQNMLLALK